MNATGNWIQGLSATLWLTSAAAVARQPATVEWKVPTSTTIRAVARRDILTVARMVGITEPISAAVPLQSACTSVQVKSKPILNGNQVLSKIVDVRQFTGAGCNQPRSDSRFQRQGDWIAFNPRTEERWRIRDGDWHIDVFLAAGVSYSDAALIVRAIRQQRLIDRRPEPRTSMARIKPETILNVQRPPVWQYSPLGQLRVMTGARDAPPLGGSGYVLYIEIRNGAVELHGLGRWIS